MTPTITTRLPGRLAAATTSVVVAGAVLVACSSDESDSADGATDTITMATQPWLGYGPWYIAEEEGYFEDEGVDVTITNFEDDSQMTAALGSGDVDVANAASHSALQWLENGLPGYISLVLDTSLQADAILAGDGIDDISDLEGKSIAYEEGSVSNLLLDHALTEAGLTVDDIDSVPMAPAEAAVALQAGRVDAAVTYEPYITDTAGADSDITTLYTAAEEPGLISDVLFVSEQAMEEKPEAVQKVIDAWGPAIDYYNSDTEAAQEIIASNIGSDAEAMRTAFDGVEFYSVEDNSTMLGGEYKDEILPSVQESALNAGIVNDEQDIDGSIDTQFVD